MLQQRLFLNILMTIAALVLRLFYFGFMVVGKIYACYFYCNDARGVDFDRII